MAALAALCRLVPLGGWQAMAGSDRESRWHADGTTENVCQVGIANLGTSKVAAHMAQHLATQKSALLSRPVLRASFVLPPVCLGCMAGDEIVAGDDIYGGTDRLLTRVVPKGGVTVR